MPWAEREALVSRIHKIGTEILTGFAGMHNFVQLFSLRYKKLKKILEIAGYGNQINISADKIEIIGKEDTVIIAPEYKIWECCNSVKNIYSKKI